MPDIVEVYGEYDEPHNSGQRDEQNQEKMDSFLHNMRESNNEAFVSVKLIERDRVVCDEKIAGRFLVSEYSDLDSLIDKVGIEYGHGKYKFTLYENGKIKTYKVFNIAKRNEVKTELPKMQNSGELKEILAVMVQQQQQTNEMMMRLMQQNQQPQQQFNRQDFLQEMVVMKQLFDSGNKSGGGMTEMIQTINALKDTGLVSIGNQSNDDDNDAGFGKLLNTFAPVVEQVLNTPQVQQQTAAQTEQQQAPQMTPEQAEILKRKKAAQAEILRQQKMQQQKQQEKQQMNFMQKQMLTMQLKALIAAAEREHDPFEKAEEIVDMVGTEKALQFLADPNAFEQLLALDPRANEPKIKAWLLDLAEYVKGVCGQPCKFDDEFKEDDNNHINANSEQRKGENPQDVASNEQDHKTGQETPQS